MSSVNGSVGAIIACNCCKASFMIEWSETNELFQHKLCDIVACFKLIAHADMQSTSRVTKRLERAYNMLQSVPLASCSPEMQSKMSSVFQSLMGKAQRMKKNARLYPLVQMMLLPMLMCICKAGNREEGQRKIHKLYTTQIKYVTHPKEALQYLLSLVDRYYSATKTVMEATDYATVFDEVDKLFTDDKLLLVGFKDMYNTRVDECRAKMNKASDEDKSYFYTEKQNVLKICEGIERRLAVVNQFLRDKSGMHQDVTDSTPV